MTAPLDHAVHSSGEIPGTVPIPSRRDLPKDRPPRGRSKRKKGEQHTQQPVPEDPPPQDQATVPTSGPDDEEHEVDYLA